MTEPELLASGPQRRLPPAVRQAVPWVSAIAILAVVILWGVGHSAPRPDPARAAIPATTPVALPSTGPAPAAAPIATDLARVLVDPARHRLRLIFTVFNAQTSPVVLLQVGADDAGLFIRHRSLARFSAGGSWQPARLPLTLATGQSAHVRLDYGVRGCADSAGSHLHVPALLTARERGRVDVDLAALVPPHDWPRGLINVLCPISSR